MTNVAPVRRDVVIVGASVAGCTAAILYGRAGLRVTLIEKHRSATTFKALCGHFVLGGTAEMLRRTGLWQPMLDAGARAGGISRWAGGAWMSPPPDAPPAISLRRERLDPLLRAIAADTPGVDLVLGESAVALSRAGDRIQGVRTRDRAGVEREYRATLVVGADGYRSTVAELAAAAQDRAPNNRFGMWAYYRGIPLPANRIWQLEPDVAIAIATDDDLTMLVAFPAKDRLPRFQADRAGALSSFVRDLPDAPDLRGAERVSKVIGMTDYPCVRRDPTPAPGVVLVGDAAIAGDPLPAVGCGWAFRSAEWLVDGTAPALRGERSMRAGLAAYRRRLRFIRRHDRLDRATALAGPPNPVQRLVMRAALVDPEIGRRAYLLGMRAVPVSALVNPVVVGRALLVARRVPATAPASAPAGPGIA
jgi:2-polyprenyl-6-methoxyphenol hydroxylase-like FAD-dependent oxidoreductase